MFGEIQGAVALLEELRPFAREGRFVFHSLRSRDRPTSNNTIDAALRRLGYTTQEQTGHGFRSMASTLLNDQGYPPDVIELQLTHAERNKVRAAYNKAQRLPERRKTFRSSRTAWVTRKRAISLPRSCTGYH